MKKRLDLWLVEQGLFSSREQARRSIMAGEVVVNGKIIDKAGYLVGEDAQIVVTDTQQKFVSRGAHKLEKALQVFTIDVTDLVCLDAGASTGGFTDLLLYSGARKVYAVDVGYGQLAWKLRQDSRVVVFERENIRYFDPNKLESLPQFICADLSFISLNLVLAKLKELAAAEASMVTLIKPQFEAGKDKVGKKGVVRDQQVHIEVIKRLIHNAPELGWYLVDLTFSPILGPEGNIEYLAYWQQRANEVSFETKVEGIVQSAWDSLY